MKKILIVVTCMGLLVCGRMAAQVPPVSSVTVVGVDCPHCGFIDFEKGQTHRSNCPYANGSSSSSSSSRSSSSSYIDPSISSAISSMGAAAGAALGAAFDEGVSDYNAGSLMSYTGSRPGDSNGKFVTGRNGRHGSVGVFDTSYSVRWWKIGPIYKDLKIYDMSSVIAMKKNGRVGVLDASGKRTKKIVPFEYDAFQVIGQSNSKGLVYALGVKDGEKMRWSIWNGNSRLIADEFDNVRLTAEGIVAESGDRYMVFNLEGQLKTILVNKK